MTLGRFCGVFFAVAVSVCAVTGYARGADAVLNELKEVEAKTKRVVEKDTAATVAIFTDGGAMGSGVIVSRDGLILTAAHVIEGEDVVAVVTPDGKDHAAKVLGANYTRDAAMLRLVGKESKEAWPYVELGDSDRLKAGDFVVALGHSKGFDPVRRAPVRLGRLETDGKQRFLISECTLIGGDSGGPLFDLDGKLVGIHSSIGAMSRINNHVPVSVFKSDWQRLLKGEKWGMLGFNPMSDPETPSFGCELLQIDGVDGAVVGEIVVDSPADKAGFQTGDVIVRLSERAIETCYDVVREFGRHKPGEEVELVVVRRGQPYKVKLVLARLGDFFGM